MEHLMKGKRGLVMGVANDHSIAWGIAEKLAEHKAEMIFTYQGEILKSRVQPLAEKAGVRLVLPCDVEDSHSVISLFNRIQKEYGALDFVVHAIGFSDKKQLQGLYADTTRENFMQTMLVSCYSFTEIARHAALLMPKGGSMMTLTYGGSVRVMPNYNVMGVAKAALESSVRYLANDYGPRNIRINALSSGPVRTLAGAGIAGARDMFSYQQRNAPLRKSVSLQEIGCSALYLLSDFSGGVTGQVHYVDAGYSIVSMPSIEELKRIEKSLA